MILPLQLAADVASGRITTLRHPVSNDPTSLWSADQPPYEPGHAYPVHVEGEAAPVGFVLVTDARVGPVGRLDEDDAMACGHSTPEAFEQAFAAQARAPYDPAAAAWTLSLATPLPYSPPDPRRPRRAPLVERPQYLPLVHLVLAHLAEVPRFRTATGTPQGVTRVARDDPRFTRPTLPDDPFGPNSARVWEVLDRFTWLTGHDAGRIRDAYWVHASNGIAADYIAIDRAAAAMSPPRTEALLAVDLLVNAYDQAIRPGSTHAPDDDASAAWRVATEVARHTARAYVVFDAPAMDNLLRDRTTAVWSAVLG